QMAWLNRACGGGAAVPFRNEWLLERRSGSASPIPAASRCWPRCAQETLLDGPERQHPAGIGDEHHGKQQPRQAAEHGAVPEPRRETLTHVTCLAGSQRIEKERRKRRICPHS